MPMIADTPVAAMARRAVHMRRKRSPVFSESAKHADCSVCGRKSSLRLTNHRARVTCQFCLRLLGDQQ